jgi:hypothetical protein
MKWPWSKSVQRQWPPLPSTGFIRGRAAGVDDVDTGTAVFCQQSDGDDLASPWPVEVPQYALWRDESGAEIPTVLVQAEAHILDQGEAVLGLRLLDGSAVVATEGEVRLLGCQPPT